MKGKWYSADIKSVEYFLFVTLPGIEPGLPPWEGDVLTVRRWDHYLNYIFFNVRFLKSNLTLNLHLEGDVLVTIQNLLILLATPSRTVVLRPFDWVPSQSHLRRARQFSALCCQEPSLHSGRWQRQASRLRGSENKILVSFIQSESLVLD